MNWGLVVSAVAALAAGPAGTTPEVAFKGAALGLKLEAWRQLPPPPQMNPSAKAVCLGDLEAPPYDRRAPIEARHGVVQCGFSVPGPYRSWDGGHIGDYEYTAGDYYFLDGTLYRIEVVAVAGAEDEIVALLTSKYGRPRTSQTAARTGVGVKVEGVRHEWRQGRQSIVLVSPDLQVDRLTLEFLDLEAAAKLRGADEQAVRPEDRL